MLLKECSFYFAHESVSTRYTTMLQFLVLSQDTLFLPDDSFFSLYRVFGVTEVFNEVLGDYYYCYVFVPGGAFLAFSIYKIAFYYPFFINVSLSMPMWQCSSLQDSLFYWAIVLFSP